MSQKKVQLLNPLSGNINVAGVITASSFVGSGEGLTGVAATDNIQTATEATFLSGVKITGVTTASGGVVGNLTGNVTGNATGLSGTPNITVGSVTAASGSFSGNVTIGGTLTYQDVEHIDSVGIITAQQGIQVLANGLDITGVSTFKSNVSIAEKIIHTGDTDTSFGFPGADAFTVETGGSERLRVDSTGDVGIGTNNPGNALHVLKNGDGQTPVFFETTNGSQGELRFYNDSNGWSLDSGGNLRFVTGRTGNGAPTRFSIDSDGIAAFTNNVSIADTIFHTGDTNTAIRFPAADTFTVETAGSERFRISSTGGAHFNNGELIERVNITAGKLSDNTNIDLEDGMAHLFTTTETTTATPNIRVNSSTTLNSVMATGDVISVSIITTAAAAGYSAQLTIDGSAVTEKWNGGSAPSAGGASGNDLYSYTIIKTGDAAYTVLANVANFA